MLPCFDPRAFDDLNSLGGLGRSKNISQGQDRFLTSFTVTQGVARPESDKTPKEILQEKVDIWLKGVEI